MHPRYLREKGATTGWSDAVSAECRLFGSPDEFEPGAREVGRMNGTGDGLPRYRAGYASDY